MQTEEAPAANYTPEGDTDPATQEWRKKNWVEAGNKVHPKAEVMAAAEDPLRTGAIKSRGIAQSDLGRGTDLGNEAANERLRRADLIDAAAKYEGEKAGFKFDEDLQAAEAARRELGEISEADERQLAEDEDSRKEQEHGRRGEMYNS